MKAIISAVALVILQVVTSKGYCAPDLCAPVRCCFPKLRRGGNNIARINNCANSQANALAVNTGVCGNANANAVSAGTNVNNVRQRIC